MRNVRFFNERKARRIKKRMFDKRIFTESYFFCHETCITLTFYVIKLINFTLTFLSLA